MFDGGGLYLEIVPSGGKWWRLTYRYDGKEKRLSLGTFHDTGLKNDVFPTLGARPIGEEVQAREIRDVVQGIEARGATETAGRVFERLRAIYRYAVAHDLVTTDATYPLKPSEILKPRRTVHRASLNERDVPAFLQQLNRYEGHTATRMALELLMLTAARPGELRSARWKEFDERGARWRIPAERM